jgi:uncharacterized protein (DUF4213/DUF364 family)
MPILDDAVQLLKERLGDDFESLTVERLVAGLFFTGVKLSNGAAGICFTPIKEIPEAVCCPSSAGRVFNPMQAYGMRVADVVAALSSPGALKVAVAIATINALSSTCWSKGWEDRYNIQINMDAADAVRMLEGSTVAVVGAIIPGLQRLKRRGGTWWVIERDTRSLKADEMDHYVSTERSEEVIRVADVLIITGVTIVNFTLDRILEVARMGAEIAVMGPTASMLPEPLFDRGVNVIGGVWVKKPDELLDVLAAGGSGYHFFDSLANRIVMENR